MRFFNATFLGVIAIMVWATGVAFTRVLTEALGPVALVVISFGAGGIISLGVELWRYRKIRILSPPSWKYLIFCGIFFLGYMLGFVPALAMGGDRQVVLQLGVVNYTWPGLVVLGAVFILKYRARWLFLAPGIVIAFLGIAICMAGKLSFGSFYHALRENYLAFGLMAWSAICWAIYSNCARKYAPEGRGNGVGVFQLVTALVFLLFYFGEVRAPVWSVSVIGPLAYYTIFNVTMSYLLWDTAMQRGRIVLLGIISYLLPLASTLFAGWYFHEPLGWPLLAGAVLVMLGAILSRYGIVSKVSYESRD